MRELTDTIREIGIFMLAAQTLLHFAAGRQYEKYIKAITSVILLLLFIEPFSGYGKDAAAHWKEQTEAWERETQAYFGGKETPVYAVDPAQTALEQIEEKIADRLNAAAADTACRVTDVSIELEEREEKAESGTARSWEFRRVKVTVEAGTLSEPEESGGQREIRIDRIVVGEEDGSGAETARDDVLQECRAVFARTLGVDEERVEVMWRGEGERTVEEDNGR